jgi:hypothetical protein
MPLARYFFFVGGVLLALLFISNAYLPESPAADSVAAVADMPVIRIHSDRKWPERVVFDTNVPVVVPAVAPTKTAEAAVPVPSTEGSAKVRVRDSFAQLQPSESPRQLQPADLKKPEPKPQRKRRIAKAHVGPPAMLVAQQPRFGFFDTAW